MTDLEPRPAELSRRIDDIGKRMDIGFRDVARRLEALPNNETILAYLETRDVDVRNIRDDVKEIAANLAKETAERRAAMEVERAARSSAIEAEVHARETQFKEQAAKADTDRKWARTFALGSLAAFIALVGVFVNAGGLG